MTNTEGKKSICQNLTKNFAHMLKTDIKRMIATAFHMFKKLSRGMQITKKDPS